VIRTLEADESCENEVGDLGEALEDERQTGNPDY